MWRPESVYDPSGHLDEGVMHAWLDGALADESAQEVEAHAASCTECAARVAEARGMIAGAARVLGALDGETSGVGRQGAAATAALERGSPGQAGMIGARRLTPDARRRWTTRRVSLAAAAVLVFAAGTVVLRDELGDGRGVREAIVGDQASGAASAPEQDFAAAPQIGVGDTGNRAGTGGFPQTAASAAGNAASGAAMAQRPVPHPAPASAPAPATPDRALAGAEAAPAPPMAAAPMFTPSVTSEVAAPPPSAPAPRTPAMARGGAVGSVAADVARRSSREEGQLTPRAAIPRGGTEGTAVTGMASETAMAKARAIQQRVDSSEHVVPPQMRASAILPRSGLWVLGCWSGAGADTLLHFDRRGLMSRTVGPLGDWYMADRIAGGVRSPVEWRPGSDSTAPARVRNWDRGRDILLWPGRDSLEAAIAPPIDQRMALTEEDRIAGEARRRNRSAAYERRFTLFRQSDRACAP